MVFRRSNKIIPTDLPLIGIDNTSINGGYSFKLLGVVLDVNFRFKENFLVVTKIIYIFTPLMYRIIGYQVAGISV